MPPLACGSTRRPQLMPMELEARAKKGTRPSVLGGSRREASQTPLESPTSLPASPSTSNSPAPVNQPVDGVQWEEDKPIVHGVPVRAATLPTIAALCVYAFDFVGGIHDLLSGFPRVLFLMHRWFCTSRDLLHALVHLEEQALRLSPCHKSTCTHSFRNISDCPAFQLRAQVCQAIRFWLLEFPVHFALDSELSRDVGDFQSRLLTEQQEDLSSLVDVHQAAPCEWITRHLSQRRAARGKQAPPTSRSAEDNDTQRTTISTAEDKGTLNLVRQLDAREIAAHLTFLEHRVMRRITFEDLKTYIQRGAAPPRLECSITFFNGLSQWIQCSVLECSTPQSRAEIVAKFVHVAKHLRDLQNFNSLMAVVGSLSHSALARLTKTMSCIPQDCQKTLADLSDLLSSSSNFSSYRKVLQTSQGFKIPILGVHLKDLVSLHVALPDTVEGGLINFRKVTQLSIIFQELQEVQKASPEFHPNRDILQTLRESLDLSHSEDEIYELSLAREPKLCPTTTTTLLSTSNPSTSTCASTEYPVPPPPALLPSPSEGGIIGSTVPSPEQQLTTMVEALFRHYDTNRDGFICKKEFASITACLPGFLDANFDVVDADQDGLISQVELKKYLSQQSGLTLPCHSFQETTYFKPTFCVHCAGLLWGLIKQGYKCRDCGVNAHKHCKDLVIFECRGRSLSMSEGNSQGSTLTSRRRFRRRKKLSHSESESSPPSPQHTSPQERASSYESPAPSCPTPASPKSQQRRLSFTSRSSSLSAPPSPKPPIHQQTLTSATLQHANPMRRTNTKDELHLPPPRRKISDSLALPFFGGGSSLVSPLLERRRKSSGAPPSANSAAINKENGNLVLTRQQHLCHQMTTVLTVGNEAPPSTPCPWLDEV